MKYCIGYGAWIQMTPQEHGWGQNNSSEKTGPRRRQPMKSMHWQNAYSRPSTLSIGLTLGPLVLDPARAATALTQRHIAAAEARTQARCPRHATPIGSPSQKPCTATPH